MAENIWEKSLGQEISTQKPNITYINKNYKYPMEKMYLRNYVNTHSIAEINAESLYQYFGDGIYKDTNGVFITHLLCELTRIPFKKRCKALQAAFQFISPNMGTIDKYNISYIQYSFLQRLCSGIWFNMKAMFDLYQLGLENGLDELYEDSNGHIISHYFFALSTFDEIKDNYKMFCDPDENIANRSGKDPLDIFWFRFIMDYDRHIESIKSHLLFSQIKEAYSDKGYNEDKFVTFVFDPYFHKEAPDVYKKIQEYYKIL